MITVFNRQELFVTQSMEQYAKVSAALDAAGIEYYAKAFGRSSQFGERSHRGSLGQVAALDNFYKVYVKMSDYELAVKCVNDARA